jgi:hypothetical protein
MNRTEKLPVNPPSQNPCHRAEYFAGALLGIALFAVLAFNPVGCVFLSVYMAKLPAHFVL